MKKTILLLIIAILIAGCSPAQSAAPSDTLKLGAILPLSGSNAFYGEFTKYGFDIAVEDINAKGGINGNPLEIVYEDSAGDKAKAVAAANKLITVNQVQGLLTVTTPMGGSVAPVAEEQGVPVIYASATNSFAENKQFVFKDFPDAGDSCEELMQHALENGHTEVAIFGTNAEFTELCYEGAKSVKDPAVYEKYNHGDNDFRAQFTKIKNSDSTAIILLAFATDCLNAYDQMKQLDMGIDIYVPFYSFGCGAEETVKPHTDILEGAIGSDIAVDNTRTDEEYIQFMEKLKLRGWTTHLIGSAMMYDAAVIMAESAVGCESTKCIADNIRAVNNFQGISGSISYNGNQIVKREMMLAEFTDKKWEIVK